jgi:hypothetical protein
LTSTSVCARRAASMACRGGIGSSRDEPRERVAEDGSLPLTQRPGVGWTRGGMPRLLIRGALVSLVCLGSVGSFYTPGVAGGLPQCSVNSITPWNRSGVVVGKGTTSCEDEVPPPSLRIAVEVQHRSRPSARWSTVASAISVVSVGTGFNVVKVPHACRTGGWRTLVSSWYRETQTEPWSRLYGTLDSPPRRINICN